MKALLILTITLIATVALTGCTDADVASRNLSRAAENFEIDRRIVFYNGVTGGYMLTIEGRCAIEDQKTQLEVTCQTGATRLPQALPGPVGQRDLFRRATQPG